MCNLIKSELDYRTGMFEARQSGLEEGREEGMEIGREEGRKIAREEDRQYFLKLLSQDLTKDEIKERLQHPAN